MKIQHLIPILFLAGYCTVSAQTNNILFNTNTSSLLTTNQAEALAMQLANKKFEETYTMYPGGVFRTNTPIYIPALGKMGYDAFFYTRVTTNYADGHWIFQFHRQTTHDTCLARVELASDGSTNQVTVERHGGLP
jgi:hypothetical protein